MAKRYQITNVRTCKATFEARFRSPAEDAIFIVERGPRERLCASRMHPDHGADRAIPLAQVPTPVLTLARMHLTVSA